jgi:hypothetical protein
MIQIPANAKVFVMHDAISFRNGIDGTAAACRLVLKIEPMDGALFVFRNKAHHSLRILYFDGSGFWLCTKRLSCGRFKSWPEGEGGAPCSPILARELQILIWGGNPSGAGFPALWRQVA